MEKTPQTMIKELVNSQKFESTADVMNAMKEMFADVLQQGMECELEEKLGYEKSERVSKNYRNGYSKKRVKTQLGEVDLRIPRDRKGEYELGIIGKYDRNADGIEEKIIGLYATRTAGRISWVSGLASMSAPSSAPVSSTI